MDVTAELRQPVVPVPLDVLAQRIGALRAREPQVSDTLRAALLADLHDLEAWIDRLLLRSSTGQSVGPREVRCISQRYLWLREQWSGHEAVA